MAGKQDGMRAASWAAGYCLSSVGLTVLNKFAIDRWNYPNLLLLMSFTANFLLAIVLDKYLRLSGKTRRNFVPMFGSEVVWRWLILTMIFVLNLLSSFKALKYTGLSTVIVFRNANSLVLAFIESQFRQVEIGNASLVGLCLILIGSIGYAWNDIDKVTGYGWVFVNSTLTICYDLQIRYLCTNWPLPMIGQQFYHCILSSPILIGMAYIGSEIRLEAIESFSILSSRSKIFIAISILAGYAISTAALNLQGLVTATSFSVLKSMNKVLVILIDAFYIAGVPTTGKSLSLVLCVFGGTWYGLTRLQRKDHIQNVQKKNR